MGTIGLQSIMFSLRKLLPKNDADKIAIVDTKVGFKDLQDLFGEHYDARLLDFGSLIKNKSRFLDTNKKWSKHNHKDFETYYNLFSPANWKKMDESLKIKHSTN